MNFVDLPDVVLEHIFSFLSYDAVAQNRIVCKRFNVVGGRVLNKGFYAVEKFNLKTIREIKAKLPRRESERRNHPLERQCSVLISVETRINMLVMTYSKWINNESCCFIPGKVIDEIYRVVRSVIKNTEAPCDNENVRAIEILQELRDISSMAIEHFDDKILPQLKRNFFRSSVDSMVEGGNDTVSLMNVLTGLVKQVIPSSPRMGFLRNSFQDALWNVGSSTPPPPQTQDPSLITPPNYLRLHIRESVNRMRLQAQSIQMANQSREIAELRKEVKEWEEKFKELNDILIKRNSQEFSNQRSSNSQSEDGSGASTSTVSSANENVKCMSNDEEENKLPCLKRRTKDMENDSGSEYKIQKLTASDQVID